MASQISFSQTQTFPANRHPVLSRFVENRGVEASIPYFRKAARRRMSTVKLRTAGVVSATATEMPKKRRAGEEHKGFVGEMRAVAMKMHTRDQAKEGEKEPEGEPVAKWEPTVEGYLRFLVDSKLVYDTLESIVAEAPCPWCKPFAIFRLRNV